MSAENRAHPRARIRLRVVYPEEGAPVSDVTQDVSKGGTFIETDRPQPLRTVVDFALEIPNRDEPWPLRGRVVWVSAPSARAGEELIGGMGLAFLWDDLAQREAFERLLESLVNQVSAPAPTEESP